MCNPLNIQLRKSYIASHFETLEGCIALTRQNTSLIMRTFFTLLTALIVCGSTSAQIDVENKFPNVITPNGDGMNDTFHIGNYTLEDGPSLTVINRWGKTIFEAQRYANQWDASESETGQYFYIIKFGDGKQYSGWLQIVK